MWVRRLKVNTVMEELEQVVAEGISWRIRISRSVAVKCTVELDVLRDVADPVFKTPVVKRKKARLSIRHVVQKNLRVRGKDQRMTQSPLQIMILMLLLALSLVALVGTTC